VWKLVVVLVVVFLLGLRIWWDFHTHPEDPFFYDETPVDCQAPFVEGGC
jgi:hypothetical protein